MDFYLPQFRYCTYRFMIQVITAAKKSFKRLEVRVPDVRSYRELRTKNLLEAVLPDDLIASYLPDKCANAYRLD